MSYSTDKMLEEMKGKIPEEKVNSIKAKNEELKKLLGTEPKDVQAIKSKLEELNHEAQAASTELYRKAQEEAAKKQEPGGQEGQAGNGAGKGPGNGNDKVVDADFTEEGKK